MHTSVEDPPTSLLDLPHGVILAILGELDLVTLCSVSRCCTTLHQLAGHPSLWPAQHPPSQWALGDVRVTLANILKLPPQVFNAQLDVRRSRRFPVYVGMHNLRTVLATSDAEGLAERVSRALQDRLVHVQQNLWRYDSWQELPPVASISVCRADGASIRAGLRPQAVVPHLVAQLQQLGWPPGPGEPPGSATALPATGSSNVSNSPKSPGSMVGPRSSCGSDTGGSRGEATAGATPLPEGLVQVLQVCQQRMRLLHAGQVLQQLRGPAGHTAATPGPTTHGAGAGPPGPACQWRPNMAALHSLAGRLPDESTARGFAASLLNQPDGADPAAAQSLAVRLFWAGLIADPGLLLYAAGRGKAAQWQHPLSAAARVVAKLQSLTQRCGSDSSSTAAPGGAAGPCGALPAEQDARASSMQAVWRAAGQAELQLCQSGLEQLLVAVSEQHNPACQPGPIYRCVQALDAAVAEYTSAHGDGSQQVLSGMMQSLHLSGSHQHHDVAVRSLQSAMHMCVLRALHWCLWLLGCW